MNTDFVAVVAKFCALLIILHLGAPFAVADDAPPAPATELAPGTTITTQNWQSYRQFMSEGLAALFEGKGFWRMPAEFRLEVGPTTSIPQPKKYLDDTAKYADGVRLIRTSDGGYVPAGYVAGMPFPHPLAGDPALTGERIFWDSYYRAAGPGGAQLHLYTGSLRQHDAELGREDGNLAARLFE